MQDLWRYASKSQRLVQPSLCTACTLRPVFERFCEALNFEPSSTLCQLGSESNNKHTEMRRSWPIACGRITRQQACNVRHMSSKHQTSTSVPSQPSHGLPTKKAVQDTSVSQFRVLSGPKKAIVILQTRRDVQTRSDARISPLDHARAADSTLATSRHGDREPVEGGINPPSPPLPP